MMPSTRGDLIAVLNTLSGGKDLAWRGDACHCPFCEDKSRSAGVYARGDKWRFKCQQHGCPTPGPMDLIDLISKRDCVSTTEVIKQRQPEPRGGAGRGVRPLGAGAVTSLFPSLSQIKIKFSPTLVHVYGQPISHAVLRLSAPDTKSGKSYMQCSKNGEGWICKAPVKPWILYNSWRLPEAGDIFVVEGEKCCDRVTQAGHFAVTSMSGAANAKHGDWSCLSGRCVYLWRDNDSAGEGYVADVLEILRGLTPKCRIYLVDPAALGLEEKGADVCDYLARFDSALWHQELSAVKAGAALLETGPKANYVKRLHAIKSGSLSAVPLPFPQLDDCCVPLLPGQLTCLCAAPGKGKSLFLLQCMIHWHSMDVPFACFMLEQSEEYHVGRLCAQLHGDANLNNMKWLSSSNQNADYALSKAEEVGSKLDAIGSCITIPPSSVTHTEVMAWVTAKAEAGVRVMAIDPVTAVDPVKNIWEADRELVFGIKKLCDKYACSVIFVTHPRGGASGVLSADSMAGGQAYGRFSQCVLWITFLKKKKDHPCQTACGTASISLNAIVHVVKASNGPGARHGVGFNWIGSELLWSEQGVVT